MSLKRMTILAVLGIMVIMTACGNNEVNIAKVLPEGAVKEITHAYPEFKVTYVTQEEANVETKFGAKFLRIDGIEKDEMREKMTDFKQTRSKKGDIFNEMD